MKNIYVGRDYFLKLEKHVHQARYLTYFASEPIIPFYIHELDSKNDKKIKDEITTKGFILLDLNQLHSFSLEELTSWQENILGGILKDKNPKKLPYCKVEAIPDSKYFVGSSLSQPLHTDEGYTNSYPQYASLLCENSSQSGGISTLLDFFQFSPKLILKFNNRLKELASPLAVTVNSIARVETKPLLLPSEDPQKLRVSYCATLKEMECSETVFTIFDYITRYIHDPKNQIRLKLKEKQLLIMDNSRILHGRTAFNLNDNRLLYRFWFSPRLCV